LSAISGEPGPTTKGGDPTTELPETAAPETGEPAAGEAAAGEAAAGEAAAGEPAAGEPAAGEAAAGEAASEHLNEGERAELERLRAASGGGAARRSRRRFGWRSIVAIVLIVIGCVLAPIAVVGVWAGNQITNTDRYVATVEPLIHDPAIQNVLTQRITNEIVNQLNITGTVDQAATQLQSRGLTRISSLLSSFGPQINSAVTNFIQSTVHTVISSQAMATAWVQVNTVAHQAVVKLLSGQGNGTLTNENGQITLNLGPLIAVVKQDLEARGFALASHIPIVNATVPLFQAKQLGKAQAGYRLVSDLKIVLPILVLVLLAAGVFAARSRRRALIGVGLGVAAAMVVLAIGLLIARTIYLNSVPASVLPTDAAAAAYDALIHFLRVGLRVILAVGLVIAIAAFITGPSRAAVRTRAALASGIAWLRNLGQRRGVSTGPFGQWVYRHRAVLRIGAVTLIALILVFWGQPTALTVILLVVILLILLGLIELLALPPAEPAAVGQE
jgi:hypothetical protein